MKIIQLNNKSKEIIEKELKLYQKFLFSKKYFVFTYPRVTRLLYPEEFLI